MSQVQGETRQPWDYVPEQGNQGGQGGQARRVQQSAQQQTPEDSPEDPTSTGGPPEEEPTPEEGGEEGGEKGGAEGGAEGGEEGGDTGEQGQGTEDQGVPQGFSLSPGTVNVLVEIGMLVLKWASTAGATPKQIQEAAGRCGLMAQGAFPPIPGLPPSKRHPGGHLLPEGQEQGTLGQIPTQHTPWTR